ncbi:MAG: flagellar hook-basal body complex protein FliE [Candidatus Zixiibacteriota bacterium]|nr:MAG: flagellar hook-basal body complex protein FliE [candidate division Zixibacteria bacterium]
MSGTIGQIGRLVPALQNQAQFNPPAEEAGESANFSEVFGKLINSVNSLQQDATQAQRLAATGEIADLHEVMVALEKAGVAMDLLLEIRNKLVDAYQSLIKMPM